MATGNWLVAWKSNYQGVLAVNTFCIHEAESPGGVAGELSAATVVDDLDSWLRTLYRACLNSAWHVDSLSVRELGSSSPTEAEKTIGQNGTLANGTGNLPAEVCQVVKIGTALATRSGRGRMFFPSPFYSSYLDAPDNWNSAAAYWTAVNAFMTALLAGHDATHDLIGHHYSLRVWSRTRGAAQDATGFTQRSRPHWLRSRSTAP
jgi:hypothetical protein